MLAALSGKERQEEFWGSSFFELEWFFETHWPSGLMQRSGIYKGKQKARETVKVQNK